MGRVDAGGACAGYPSPPGRLCHPEDAAHLLQVQAPASGLTQPAPPKRKFLSF